MKWGYKTSQIGYASIEPRLFSRGYHRGRFRLSNPRHSCFNRATAFQPWIRCPRLILASSESSFNRATAFQPWIHSYPLLLRLGRCRFNRATAFQPWIRQTLHGFSDALEDASIEPRLFSRGYFLLLNVDANMLPISASIEPRLFSRGYQVAPLRATARHKLLQ